MDSIILSFELGTFPDSGIYLNIGDAGYVEPNKEGELVFFLTETTGGPEVMISKHTAMLLYEDGMVKKECSWDEHIIYCEGAVAKGYNTYRDSVFFPSGPVRESDFVDDNINSEDC